MAEVIHLHCQHCGEPLARSGWPYCPPCNLDLCYKAMPILLGMFLTSQLRPGQPLRVRTDPPTPNSSYTAGDDPCILVGYQIVEPIGRHVSAYLDEPCIMVAY